MAMQLGNRSDEAMADINITPFVDVVLVLLIIFMITAHVMEYGVQVDVPRTRQVSETTEEMAVVNISNQGELFLNDKPVNINDLAQRLEPMMGRKRAAYLRCDRNVTWEVPVQVMAELAKAKVMVNVVSQPLERSQRGK
jgi:biopolymer transport protein ExbD